MARFTMRQLKLSGILDLYSARDSIQMDPDYQRIGGIWEEDARQLLIDSIINGFDLPKLYFHDLIPVREIRGRTYRHAVIDGKQRLLAIWEFMDNRLRLANDFQVIDNPEIRAGGATYSELAIEFPHLRARFDSAELPVIAVHSEDVELIEELFTRLNEAVALNAPEKRNALGGPLPRVFRRLAKHPFFQECLPFPDGRYVYLDYAAKFSYIAQAGDFITTKKSDLDKFVTDYKSKRKLGESMASAPAVGRLQAKTRKTLAAMYAFFGPSDGLLSSRGWVTLFFYLFMFIGDERPPRGLTRSKLRQIQETLAEANKIAIQIRRGVVTRDYQPDAWVQEFLRLGQSSNDGNALLGRYTILQQMLSEQFDILLPDKPDPN